MWAIQRADERWLAVDYGWTTRPDGMLRFRYSHEGEEQVVRLVTSGVAWLPCPTRPARTRPPRASIAADRILDRPEASRSSVRPLVPGVWSEPGNLLRQRGDSCGTLPGFVVPRPGHRGVSVGWSGECRSSYSGRDCSPSTLCIRRSRGVAARDAPPIPTTRITRRPR
jgi:hypothetical protein